MRKFFLSCFLFSVFCVFAQSPSEKWRENLAMPVYSEDSVVLEHEGFIICYSPQHKQAHWVASRLTAIEQYANQERTDKFVVDPLYPRCSNAKDYSKSGYDRGHLFPAADAWTKTIMRESFYYTNMSPQSPSFNRGIWKKMEEKVRDWAMDYDTIYVISGCVLTPDLPTIGKGVSIPEYYYKVILINTAEYRQGLVFYIRNEKAASTDLRKYVRTIDFLEKELQVNFCSSLSDSLQQKIESRVDFDDWLFD